MTEYVYAISSDDGYIKVGISKAPSRRIKTLQQNNPANLQFIATSKVQGAEIIEKAALNRLSPYCVRGEWHTDCDDVREIVRLLVGSDIAYELDSEPKPRPVATYGNPENGRDIGAAQRTKRWRENNPEAYKEYQRQYMREYRKRRNK